MLGVVLVLQVAQGVYDMRALNCPLLIEPVSPKSQGCCEGRGISRVGWPAPKRTDD
jgi:hypothetical protein